MSNLSVGIPSTSLPEGFTPRRVRPASGNPEYDAIYGALVAASPKWVPINGSETLTYKAKWAMYAAVTGRVKRDFKKSKKLQCSTDDRDKKMYIRLIVAD